MKTNEILLASAVLSVVAGAGAALATRAFVSNSARGEGESRAGELHLAASPDSAQAPRDEHALDQLRLENTALRARLDALEQRLAETPTTRAPLEVVERKAAGVEGSGEGSDVAAMLSSDDGIAVTPAFVASVDRALATIKAREEAERETKRKELQAQRVEERLTKLQTELGLSNRQTSDLRTTLITQDDKREALFASMRDSTGDPRDMRDGFRTIRDETYASLEKILTPEQLEGYKGSEERDWGGRGPGGDRGGPPGGFPGGGLGGSQDSGRGRREGR